MTTPVPATAIVAAPDPGTVAADVTRTCQDDSPFTSAGLVAALEQAWTAIRTRHPEVPAAIVVVGSGSPTKASQSMKWGHFDTARWQAGADRLPEVLVSGEGLSRTPDKVFTTLLHEAVHGLADARGIKDTSRQGRWHNQHFAKLAAELGMTTEKDDKLGFSPCTLTDTTVSHYQGQIQALGAALRAYRHADTLAGKTRTTNNNGVTAECECPRKVRLAAPVLDQGPIWCGTCQQAFLPEDTDRDAYMIEHPYPGTDRTDLDNDDEDQDDEREEDSVFFYDPTGARFGIPTYPYRGAPAGLATIRQLRAQGLRPAGQDPAAQMLWRKGKRVAYLYLISRAAPKRTATPAQLAAIDKALIARRTCDTCGETKDYYIPRRHGECYDCAPGGTR